jgi:hypothetical protein
MVFYNQVMTSVSEVLQVVRVLVEKGKKVPTSTKH